jgi:hypothetical protein
MQLPSWAQRPWLVSAVAAVALGGMLLLGRNWVSDGIRFQVAVSENDVASWRAYLAHGFRYEDDAKNVLLPRAELADAKKEKSAAALVAFKESHPDTRIGDEIDGALRTQLLAELEIAKQPDTLAALNAFESRLPTQLVTKELADAKHGVYARALARAKAELKADNKKAGPFLDRLFAYAERKGGRIELRFRRKPSTNMERADGYVEKSPVYNGTISRPTRYFDEKHQEKREVALTEGITEVLKKHLPEELFSIARGANVDDAGARATVPTLLVTHITDWSGHQYNSRNPRGAFVGITYGFDIAFLLPDGSDPFAYKTEVFRPAALQALKENELGQEGRCYDAMNDEALTTLKKRFTAALFGK